MKKIELSKNELASIIGGRSRRTRKEVDCTVTTDKIDRCGRLKWSKQSDAEPIAFGGGGDTGGGGDPEGQWNSSGWPYVMKWKL